MISEFEHRVKLTVIIIIILIIKTINQLNGFLNVHNLKLDNDGNDLNSIIAGFVTRK